MSAVSVSESGVRPILAEAVGLARRALLELQPTGVGEHLGVTGEDECAATHRFAATLPGYRGWQWAVVVAAAPEAEYATVSESALLPGPDALVAPEFVPWEQRVRPGDLAPGDLLAPRVNDERLVPGYLQSGDPVADEVCEDIGLGRRQVLSREGRYEAAERWYSEFGPDTDMARSAPGTCGVCGFFVPLAGAMRAAFGVCANAMGADGRVVHVRYGCGAHSDTEMPTGAGSPLYEAYDDAAVELIPAAEPASRVPASGTADTSEPSTTETAAVSDAAGIGGPSSDPAADGDVTATPAAGTPEADAPVANSPAPVVNPADLSGASGTSGAAVIGGPASDSGVESVSDAEAEPSAESAGGPVAATESPAGTAAEPDAEGPHSAAASEADTSAPAGEAPESSETTAASETSDAPQDAPAASSDAWAVSAVRVQRDTPGAAEH